MRRILAAIMAATVVAALPFGEAHSQDTSFNRIITLGAGLTNQVGVCNTGFQTIGSAGGTLSPQSCAQAYTSNHMVVLGDGVQLYLANGSGSITFTLARANGLTTSGADGVGFCFADLSQHGFTLATTTSTFSGFPGVGGSSAAFQANSSVCASSDGADHWSLAVTPGLATIAAFGVLKPDGTTIVISNGVISATAASGVNRVIANGATDSATTADGTIVWNSSSSSAKTEILPQCTSSAPIVGHTFWVKGGKGDEATNNITVQAAGGSTVDGNGSAIISVARAGYGFQCDAAGGNYDVLTYYAGNGVFGGGPTACGAVQTDFTVTTGCNAIALPVMIR
jgi:hypothetical protein